MLEDITQEHMVQSHYVDMTVKTKLWDSQQKKYEHKVIFFIEVKSIDTTLRQTHVYQAVNYAATAGIDLVLLTNLIDYHLYHISWEKKAVEPLLVMSFNVLSDELNEIAQKLGLLSSTAFRKGNIQQYIREATTLSDLNFMTALLSPRVLSALRNSLRDITGHRIKDNSSIVKNIRKLIDNDELYDDARKIVSKLWSTPVKKSKLKYELASDNIAPQATQGPLTNE